jgi:hypothetical protein
MSAFQLGLDRSGNANHFNVAGVSETDRVIDTPTNNFAVFNKLIGHDNTAVYSEGNLSFKTNTSGGQDVTTVSTIQVNTGKWYAEFYTKASSRDGDFMVGIAENPDELNRASKYMGETGNSYGYYIYTGDVYNGNGSNTDNYGSQGDNALNNDSIFSVAVDFDANKIWFANNGTFQQGADPTNGNNSVAIAADVTYGIGVSHATGGSNWVHWIGNYGQDSTFAGNKTQQGYQDSNSIGDFYYAPPAGFLALCTENLSDPDIIPTDYFSAIKYDGNATDDRTVTGVGFSPGFVWSKAFTTTYNHFMVDTVRGVNAYVNSNRNNAESSDTDILKSFDADGYTLGNSGNMNESGHSHAAWNWKSGGSGSANNAGNNNATVSVVTEAKFSIVAYTGTGGEPKTVAHGLGVSPEFIMIKRRNDTNGWVVWTKDLDDNYAFEGLHNTTAAVSGGSPISKYVDAVSSTLVTLGDANENNASGGTFIMYCWASVEGYSRFGNYTGNGTSDGPFVYLGFKPAFIMTKRADAGDNWRITDNARDPFNNAAIGGLKANATDSEGDTGNRNFDYLSNGFKVRETDVDMNADGGNYIYMAFAEVPLKYASAR